MRVGRHVDHQPAVGPLVAPAVGHVGGRHRRDVARPAVLHRHPVEVAAVLGRETRDEGRTPERPEARAVAHRGDAGEDGVDEHRPPGRVPGNVVDVEIAGDPGKPRHEDGVVAGMALSGGKRVVEAEQLVMGGEEEPARVRADAEAHAAGEAPLVDGERAVGSDAEQEQLPGLVGGEGDAAARPRQPRHEASRRGEREGFFRCVGGCGHAATQARRRPIRQST